MTIPKSTASRVTADFPAICIPALAAWQGEAPPFDGAWIEPHPDRPDDLIRLTATDGHNLLCLNVAGRLAGKPFQFEIPPGLAECCMPKPEIELWSEGDRVMTCFAVHPPLFRRLAEIEGADDA